MGPDDPLRVWLASYKPKFIPAQDWSAGLGAFVRSEVVRLDIDLERATRIARLLARLGAWCLAEGVPLEVERVLDPDVLNRFVRLVGRQRSPSTVSTWRSDARLAGRALTRRAPWEPPDESLARVSGSCPFSESELRKIERDAPHQPTALQSRAVRAVVALGLGVALDGRWNCRVRGVDVIEHSGGVRVVVPEPHARVVEARSAYARDLLDLATTAGELSLVGRLPHSKNAPNVIAQKAIIDQGRIALNAGRLRSSWVVAQLSAGTHVTVVLRAAGCESLHALRDLMRYVRPPGEAEAAQELRRA